MRHRTRLLTVALTCTLALAGCGSRSSDGAPSAADTTASTPELSQTPEMPAPTSADPDPAATEIPDDFPLSSAMGGPQDTISTSRTGTGLRDLMLCDTAPLRGLGVRDRMVADNSGGETANTRELVLLSTPDEAVQVAQAFTDLPTDCDTPTVRGNMETRTQVHDSPFGPAPAATLLQTYTFDGEAGTGATVLHVVPVGAALLVTSTYGRWTQETLDEALDATVAPLRQTVEALDLFDGDSTPGSEASGTPPVADDFPLAVGLPEDGGDYEVTPPSPDAEGMGELEMCGQVVWPLDSAGGTQRLVTGALGPEYFDGRELIVHADAEVAGNAMAAIRAAAAECRRFDNEVWTVLERSTGYDTVTMGLTYSDGLGSSVFQATRVGSARLMVHTYGEGSLESLARQADEVTDTTRSIVPAMCAFTEKGC